MRVFEDATSSGIARQYFQTSGSLTVKTGSDVLNGTVHATLTNVKLVEVTIASDFTSTPVPNGACVIINTAPVDVVWTCDPSYAGDDSCDCGCGSLDIDCADATSASCTYCDDPGSCGVADCSNIDPNNNGVCTP